MGAAVSVLLALIARCILRLEEQIKGSLVGVKALRMRIQKLVLGLSLAQILSEEINKMFSPNNLGFIDVNQSEHSYVLNEFLPSLSKCKTKCFLTKT